MTEVGAWLLFVAFALVAGFGGGMGFAFILAKRLDAYVERHMRDIEERFPAEDE